MPAGFHSGSRALQGRFDTTALALRIPAGTLVYEVVRIRLADQVRISLETARIPVSIAPDLLAQPLDDSIYDLLTNRYQVTCVKAVERMVAVLADQEQAGLLGIKAGDPLMAIERIAFDAADQPVEYANGLFCGDRTRVIAWAHVQVAAPG